MTLQQMRYITTIADTGSINKASELLYVSQPSLTAAIQEVEREVGFAVFHRGGRGVTPTADGQELEMNAALRRFFSYVPQGNTLLSGTIADNLRMVQPEADDAALEQALRAACAWDFVSKMPEGMASTVGEHGHGLSEGQAQRIAIARALLRDAPVLLLDEATSALDVATERTILRNLVRDYPHKTCIVTTHRPTVISLCQRVYQVSGGVLRQLSDQEAQRLAMEF